MFLRPVDVTGDILPVMSSADLLSGPEAAARLAEYRLSLLQGEWWENPEAGFFILERMRESRITEGEVSALASQVTAFIRETPGVQDVENVWFSVSGRRFLYACEIRTEGGTAEMSYEEEVL